MFSLPYKTAFISLICGCVAFYSAHADTPTRIHTDGDGITQIELFRTGLFYWKNDAFCISPGVSGQNGTVRLMPQPPHVTRLITSCSLLDNVGANVVRDDSYVYLFEGGHLLRKAVNLPEAVLPGDLPTPIVLGHERTSSFLVYDSGRLFWQEYNGDKGLGTIYSVLADGSDGRLEVADVDGLLRNMLIRNYHNTENPPKMHRALFFLRDNTHGGTTLYRYDFESGQTVALYTGNAETSIYAFCFQVVDAQSEAIFALTPYVPGKRPSALMPPRGNQLIRIHPATGAVSILLQRASHYFTALTSDAANLYWIEQGGSDPGPYETTIYRRSLSGGTAASLAVFNATRCDNLVSDGQRLYYVRDGDSGDEIWRLGALDAPLALDFQVDGVEIVQTTQVLNRISYTPTDLIARRPTYVRAYAHVAASQYPQPGFSPGCELRVWNNGQERGVLQPVSAPRFIDRTSGRALRENLSKSYLFQIPTEWLQPNTITVRFTINPHGRYQETGTAANFAEATNVLLDKGEPCLMFVPVRVMNAPTATTSLPRFGDIIERAKSLLPVENLRAYTQSEDLANLIVQPVPWRDGFPWYFRGFYVPGQEDLILARLVVRDRLSSDPPGCSVTHYVGMIHPNIRDFNGLGIVAQDLGILGTLYQRDLIFRMEVNSNPSPYNNPYAGRTLAH